MRFTSHSNPSNIIKLSTNFDQKNNKNSKKLHYGSWPFGEPWYCEPKKNFFLIFFLQKFLFLFIFTISVFNISVLFFFFDQKSSKSSKKNSKKPKIVLVLNFDLFSSFIRHLSKMLSTFLRLSTSIFFNKDQERVRNYCHN